MGADVVLDPKQCDVVAEIKKLTGGGADVAIEALGLQETFENALRCLRPGGTLSSLGVYSGKLQVPYDAFAAGHRRLQNRDDTLPGRQGTDAPADVDGAIEAFRSDAAAHAQFQTRSNRRSIRSLRLAPRRMPESGDQALTSENHPDKKCNF